MSRLKTVMYAFTQNELHLWCLKVIKLLHSEWSVTKRYDSVVLLEYNDGNKFFIIYSHLIEKIHKIM